MSFDSVMKKVARKAADLSDDVMHNLATGSVAHEDDLTGFLAGALAIGLNNFRTEGVTWHASIMTHRRSGQERATGADMLIHIRLDTPEQFYAKGVLIQAKRNGPSQNMSVREHNVLLNQCATMLSITPSAFVFGYDPAGMRCASATKVIGTQERDLYAQCDWTAYRFFLELFRCPIGDSRISLPSAANLPKVSSGPTERSLAVVGKGTLHSPRTRVLRLKD